VPGPGIFTGLKSVIGNRERGGLVLLEMSSLNHLCTAEYQQETMALAKQYRDFVFGVISMHPAEKEFLTLTPGVQFGSKGDKLGQVYRDPRAVVRCGSDVIIVGRGVTGAKDIEVAAKEYQREGWGGYLERVQG
jgi:orotidine-5'-phosphate decarboxylase